MNKNNMTTPKIYTEMHLVFDNDFDVNKITEILRLQPNECKIKSQTRINPITSQHNPGFWTLKSKIITGFDAKPAIDDIVLKIADKTEQIKNICREYKGEVYFNIVPSFECNNTPAVYFERDFLKIVNELNAEVEIDLYAFGGK